MVFALALLGATIPLVDPSRALMGAGSLAELTLIFLVLGGCGVAWRGPRPPWSAIQTLVLLYGLLGAISATLLGGRGLLWGSVAWADRIRPIEYAVAFFSIRFAMTTEGRRRAFAAGLWTGALVALLLGVFHWVLGPDAFPFTTWGPHSQFFSTDRSDFRVFGSFGNTLNLTGYAVAFFGMSLAAAGAAGNWASRLRLGALAVGLCILAVATGSKVVLPAIGIALLISRTRLLVWVLPVALVLILGLGIGTVLQSRLDLDGGGDGGTVQRLMAYQSSLQMALDHPLLGVGPGAFSGAYESTYRLLGSSGDPETFTAENLLLSTAAQLGIPCALALLAALLLAIRYGFRTIDEPVPSGWMGLTPRAVSAGLASFLVVGMIQNMGSADLNLLLFALLAVADAMHAQVSDPLSEIAADGERDRLAGMTQPS